MQYAVPPPAIPSVEIAGTDARFPVHRIYCVGRNYGAHAREMGFDPDREPPFFFSKPADAIVPNGAELPYPLASSNVHPELEMVVAIGEPALEVSVDDALDRVFGYAVGIDLTRRDLQLAARDKGRPWDAGKAFDNAAPCARIHPLAEVGHPTDSAIWFKVNGETRQSATLAELIWSVPEVISILSGLFRLMPGDLIYTGTPAGVAPIEKGDQLNGGVDGLGEINIKIV